MGERECEVGERVRVGGEWGLGDVGERKCEVGERVRVGVEVEVGGRGGERM